MLRVVVVSTMFLLAGCGITKGTSVDYVPLLINQPDCSTTKLDATNFEFRPMIKLFEVTVGDDAQCFDSPKGKSFYKAIVSDQSFLRIKLRSFYARTGDRARLFFPEVYSYDVNTGKYREGIMEYMDDLHSSELGNYLEVEYFFNSPVERIVIFTDSANKKQSYDYEERHTGGGMVSPAGFFFYDFIRGYDIAFNAGGPLEVMLLNY